MRVPAEPDRDADLVLARAADEIERLRAENAALRADAERYRWLREQHEGSDGGDPLAEAFCVFCPDDHHGIAPVGCLTGELDSAIDAAKEQTCHSD